MTTRERVAALPDVPTVAESGFPKFEVDVWVGMFVPAATPQPIVDPLYAATAKALANPELKAALLAQGSQVIGKPPTETAATIATEIKQWRKLIADRDIKPE